MVIPKLNILEFFLKEAWWCNLEIAFCWAFSDWILGVDFVFALVHWQGIFKHDLVKIFFDLLFENHFLNFEEKKYSHIYEISKESMNKLPHLTSKIFCTFVCLISLPFLNHLMSGAGKPWILQSITSCLWCWLSLFSNGTFTTGGTVKNWKEF